MSELRDDLHDRLLDLETRGWTALSSGAGGGFYRDRLSADASMVLPIGVLGREASIQAMEQAPPWARFELTDAHTTALGEARPPPSTAVIMHLFALGTANNYMITTDDLTHDRPRGGALNGRHREAGASQPCGRNTARTQPSFFVLNIS